MIIKCELLYQPVDLIEERSNGAMLRGTSKIQELHFRFYRHLAIEMTMNVSVYQLGCGNDDNAQILLEC